ncbi:cytosolic thioredoxin Trx1 [Planoprotostelium fungivorum]|uniref:Thioredoxin n=1 Tax=Planoprotostelium fungivorum TaxID=1890364 RepID=A0A2P6MP10_9EUKA|nr:cytosolic thioredoxin Trx1 [Planoprotostelium fungivorum]
MPVQHITSTEQFNSIIAKDTLTVVDFFADWCGPCKRIAPFLETLSNEFTNAQFVKVNVEEQEGISKEHNIAAMPTFLFFKGGKKVADLVGADQNKLKGIIEKNYSA